MKINLLRQKILDLAIRGKLVPQDPNDEPASVLLERIRAEKERLIAEGKIKRPKKSKATSSESHYQQFEPPFDIPESWEWVRLGDVCISITAGGDKPFNFSKDKTEKFTIPIFSNGIEKDGLYGYTDRATIDEESITISARGTIGFCKIRTEPYVPIIRLLVVIPSKLLSIDYLLLAISSLINTGEGSSIPQLTVPTIKEVYLPLPPYPEQLKITKKFDEINNEIEIINRENIQLTSEINLAKSKILDLAMQGKLVPQDPSDEPAADMLRRINSKARIITDNPHYWNIPKSWCWCQLGDIFKHNTGKALNSSNKDGIAYEYITTSNVYWGKFELHSLKKMLFKDNEIDKCLVKKGDLLICEGGDVGRAAVWDLDTTIMIQNHLHRLRPYSERISAKLYCIFMKAFKDKQLIGGKGIALQGFSSNALHKLIMPLPPASEQKRILAKIEELFSVLDSIEASLQS